MDQDRSRESREYIDRLRNTQYLDVVAVAQRTEDVEEALRRTSARVGVIIPPNFARQMGTATPPQIQVLLDGSDSQVANPARQVFLGLRQGHGSTVEPRIQTLYNPTSRTQVYSIPGLLAIVLQLVIVTLTAFSVVREREAGSMDQLMVSPVGKLGLILGKLVPYAVLAFVEFWGILLLARLIFDIPVVGNLPLLAVLALLYIVATLALGLLISTVARTQGQALQYAMMTILPSVLLSGYIAPRETLPGVLQLISSVLPATHFIEITRGIMVRGADWTHLIPSILTLIAISLVLLALATISFRKTLE